MTTEELMGEWGTFWLEVQDTVLKVGGHTPRELMTPEAMATLFLAREARGLRETLDRVMTGDQDMNEALRVVDTNRGQPLPRRQRCRRS